MVALLTQADPESLALVWTMVERHNPEVAAAPFWQALPDSFATGAHPMLWIPP